MIGAIVERALHRRGADDARRRASTATASSSRPTLGAQRGQRREGRPRSGCSRWSSRSTAGRCRRFGCDGVVCRHADRVDGVHLQRRRSGRLARGRGDADGADQRPRPVRPADGGGARRSVLAVEVLAQTEGAGVLWCDGRRTVDLPPGARIEVRRGVRRSGWCGCTRRRSPTGSWPSSASPSRAGAARRAAARRRERLTPMIEEIRITLARRHRRVGPRARPRAHRDHRRDRRRQDHGRHGARAAARRARRLRRRAHGRPRRPASRASWSPPTTRSRPIAEEQRRRGRGRRTAARRAGLGRGPLPRLPRAAPRCRRPRSAASARRSSPCTASPTSTGCCARAPQREALDAFAGADARRRCWRRTPPSFDAAPRGRGRAARGARARPASGPARPTCCGWASTEIEAVAPAPGEDVDLAAEESGSASPTPCARAAEAAREALSGRRATLARRARTRLEHGCAAARWRACASTTPRPRRWPTGSPRSATCSPTSPPTSPPTPPASRPTRPGWPRSPSDGPR